MSFFKRDCNNNLVQVIRKLGDAELIYDYEHSIGNIILSHAFKLKTKLDLFDNIHLIDRAIFNWKQTNAFLRCKIVDFDLKRDKRISSEKYFAFVDDEQIRLSTNVFYVRSRKPLAVDAWRLLYNREYNIPFFNVSKELLWRLTFFRVDETNFYLYLTIHHSIVDARNVFTIIEDLLHMITLELNGKSSEREISNEIEPNIERKIETHGPKNYAIPKHFFDKEFTEFGKIPVALSADSLVTSNFDSSDYEIFKFLNGHIIECDFILEKCPSIVSRTTSVLLNKEKLEKLLKKCKENESKLTGCMHLVSILATKKLYSFFNVATNKLIDHVQYHYIANLRPFLEPALSNSVMGYFAVVFNGVFDGHVDLENFWSHAKLESDLIHERLKLNEHFENAKHDRLLLDEINSGKEYTNTCVHFALSNLGVMGSLNANSLIQIDEHYFGTSTLQDRWSALLFHGLTTVNNQLCWSITYNPIYVRDEVAFKLKEFIEIILNNIII